MANTDTETPTFKEVSLEDIPEVTRAGKASKAIEDFLASGSQAWEMSTGAKNFHASLRRFVKANPDTPVSVLNRGGNTYLVRTDGAEAEAYAE